MDKTDLIITGTHCSGCQLNIESQIGAMPGVGRISVDHITGSAHIEYDGHLVSPDAIKDKIISIGYGVAAKHGGGGEKRLLEQEATNNSSANSSTRTSLVRNIIFYGMILLVILLIIFLQDRYSGEILSQLNSKSLSVGIIFLAGLLVSFHCVSMCGGLIVAYTAQNIIAQAESGSGNKITNNYLPHLRYNAGRLLSYALMGALLGGLGSFFAINPIFTGSIVLIAALFMILMGLSFIIRQSWLQRMLSGTPDFIGRYLFKKIGSSRSNDPFIMGLLNVFMPCGPLQAMEVFALSTGSPWQGALALGIFSAGTIPMLFGFGNLLHYLSRDRIRQIVKVSGVLLVILGIMMLGRGISSLGFYGKSSAEEAGPSGRPDIQTVNMDLTYAGYQPNVLYIKPNLPVRWVINVVEMSGCTDAIQIESLGIKKDLKYGENIIEFTPPSGVSEIRFSCWMKMVWGKFVVK